MFYNYLRNRLTSDAKPTLFDIPNPPPTVSSKRRPLQREESPAAPPGTCNSIKARTVHEDLEIDLKYKTVDSHSVLRRLWTSIFC
jgi:hypothetical protein